MTFSRKFSQSLCSESSAPPGRTSSTIGLGRDLDGERKYSICRSDSSIGSIHLQRTKTSARMGTTRFDACKVFLGNLCFQETEETVKGWICAQLGIPRDILLNAVKLVRDWRTGRSKGYAFVEFADPIYATLCIDKCDNKDFHGRMVSVAQGVRKPEVTPSRFHTQLLTQEVCLKPGLLDEGHEES